MPVFHDLRNIYLLSSCTSPFIFLFDIHLSLTFTCDIHFICWVFQWSYWFEQQIMDCIWYFGSYLGSNIVTLLFNNIEVYQAGQKVKSIYQTNKDHLLQCISSLNFLHDILYGGISNFERFSIPSYSICFDGINR